MPDNPMRNLFDQYVQPENRVTHALMTALHEDPALLRAFLQDVARVEPRSKVALQVHQQTYPGSLEGEPAEGDPERKGIPDAWITCGDDWCLLIENKVLVRATKDQLARHLVTARRLGFTNIKAVVLTVGEPIGELPDGVQVVEWTTVYEWLLQNAKTHPWAKRVAEFLEVIEGKLAQQEQLMAGTLTTFTGVPFGDDAPFTYSEAKRVLGLMGGELRKRSDLRQELHIDPAAPGRPKITGEGGDVVWDFLALKSSAGDDFNRFPHLTFALLRLSVEALLTVPDSVRPASRRRIVDLGRNGFADLIRDVLDRMRPALKKCEGLEPRIRIMQRHWITRSSAPVHDGYLIFDPRTAFEGFDRQVKVQREWMDAAFGCLANKNSNLQLQVGAYFPYARCPVTRSREILDRVAEVWIACGPLIDALTSEDGGS